MEQTMERTRTAEQLPTIADGAPGPDNEGMETLVAQEILAAADRILDSIKPINAQQYLEQNQQRGGE
jgi:hypothetical protein